MTEDELKAIEDIASKATAGPWHLAIASSGDEAESNIEAGHTDIAYDVPNADAIFITHARENVPALVAEVRRLREENEHLNSELQRAHDRNTRLSYVAYPARNASGE